MERNLAQDVKVGVFVVAVLALGALALWLLGGQGELFKERYTLHASFADVAGLRQGAGVRLAGIDVGEVSRISFHEDLAEQRIPIEMTLKAEFAPRIRADSEARIETEGMLGDKFIAITVGSLERENEAGELEPVAALADGDEIAVVETPGLLEYQAQATEVLDDVHDIARKVNLALGGAEDAERASLTRIATQVEALLDDVENGDGLLHGLIYDDQLARTTSRTIQNLESASGSFAHMMGEVRAGDGFAHELVYGSEGAELARQLGDLARALDALVDDIEKEGGVLHALIYDPERAGMVEDLHASVTSLRAVTDAVENGEGTLGLLAQDPALYEDLRALVGGAQRNKLLRTYVRQTIAKGEEQDAGPWAE